MTVSSTDIKYGLKGYHADLTDNNPRPEAHGDGMSAWINPQDELDAFIAQQNDSKKIHGPYPGHRINCFYGNAAIDSVVSTHLRTIYLFASTCLISSSATAILTNIKTRAFSSAFSSAFK